MANPADMHMRDPIILPPPCALEHRRCSFRVRLSDDARHLRIDTEGVASAIAGGVHWKLDAVVAISAPAGERRKVSLNEASPAEAHAYLTGGRIGDHRNTIESLLLEVADVYATRHLDHMHFSQIALAEARLRALFARALASGLSTDTALHVFLREIWSWEEVIAQCEPLPFRLGWIYLDAAGVRAKPFATAESGWIPCNLHDRLKPTVAVHGLDGVARCIVADGTPLVLRDGNLIPLDPASSGEPLAPAKDRIPAAVALP